jgi:hypothetical protein
MIRIFHTTRHHISGHRGANLTRKCFPLKWFAECPFRSSKISTVKRPKVEDETIGWRKENWPIKYVNLLHFVMRVWFTDLPTFEQRWWEKRVLSNDAVNCWDYTASVTDDWHTTMEYGWNYTNGGKEEVFRENPCSSALCPQKKFHKDWNELIFSVKWGGSGDER